MDELIGKQIQLTGDHPFTGERGTVRDKKSTFFGIEGLVIDLESGMQCTVFHRSQYRVINEC
ncbi:MAG: hypothetical protein AB9835_10275 [Eubacteriales bacterium]